MRIEHTCSSALNTMYINPRIEHTHMLALIFLCGYASYIHSIYCCLHPDVCAGLFLLVLAGLTSALYHCSESFSALHFCHCHGKSFIQHRVQAGGSHVFVSL